MAKTATRFTPIIFAILLAAVVTLRATEQDAARPVKPASPSAAGENATTKRASIYPFQGVVARVDKPTMTVELEGKEKPRVILVTSQTRIEKEGKPAVFDNVTVGEKVTGQLSKNAEGKEEFISLYLGPKPGPAKSAPAKGPAKKGPAKKEPPKTDEQ